MHLTSTSAFTSTYVIPRKTPISPVSGLEQKPSGAKHHEVFRCALSRDIRQTGRRWTTSWRNGGALARGEARHIEKSCTLPVGPAKPGSVKHLHNTCRRGSHRQMAGIVGTPNSQCGIMGNSTCCMGMPNDVKTVLLECFDERAIGSIAMPKGFGNWKVPIARQSSMTGACEATIGEMLAQHTTSCGRQKKCGETTNLPSRDDITLPLMELKLKHHPPSATGRQWLVASVQPKCWWCLTE